MRKKFATIVVAVLTTTFVGCSAEESLEQTELQMPEDFETKMREVPGREIDRGEMLEDFEISEEMPDRENSVRSSRHGRMMDGRMEDLSNEEQAELDVLIEAGDTEAVQEFMLNLRAEESEVAE